MSDNNKQLLDATQLLRLKDARVAIVHTEWNHSIVQELVNGCESMLHRFGAVLCSNNAVPGCFELPFACKRVWEHLKDREDRPEAIIAFGAVIRGGTPHFEYVCEAVTHGINQLNLTLPIPVLFGVLTLDTEAQAWERLGGPHGHKGEEAALSALKMIDFCRSKAL
jgi:6,7-dimethyl-8-ribityllumazine synthase